MGFLNKLFGSKDTGNEPANENTPETQPPKTETELLEQYAAVALEKQIDLYEVIGDSAWNFDMKSGTITFGKEFVFPVQVLGTFSHSSETWLWAWANEGSNIPQNLLEQALRLKTYGEQHGIDLLRNPEFDATTQDLHAVGCVASGMFGASGYYLANYGQGTMVATVKSDEVDNLRKDDIPRLLTTFPQVISQFNVNHKAAFIHYVTAKGYAVTGNGNTVTATHQTGNATATFDNLGRLADLTGTAGGR